MQDAAYIYRNPVSGCTDPYADNYNEDATVNDGSCSGYPEDGDHALDFNGPSNQLCILIIL